MPTLRIMSLIFILLFSVAPNNAVALSTGAEFLRACGAVVKQAEGIEISPKEKVESIHCMAYMSGFTDAVSLSNHFYKPSTQKICLPKKGASSEQLARIVTKWLAESPEILHLTVRVEIMFALEKAFPCR